jgi:type II secretory pathway pseudopilin PulG
MKHRPAATLIEVLVAIFVTAIGLLALLALFPLGTLSMAQAIRNNRCSQAAANAKAVYKIQRLAYDPLVTTAFAGAGTAWPPLTQPGTPSYPVYVDTTGVALGYPTLGDMNYPTTNQPPRSPGIPRVPASFATNTADLLRWMTLLDDITFPSNGVPVTPVQREGRYSWCYLLQRPNHLSDQLTNLTVVVYTGRSQAVRGEASYAVNWTAGTNTVIVPWNPAVGQERPAVRTGSWVLDATVIAPPTPDPDPHGFFYRVVNVSETTYQYNPPGGPTVPALLLELQTTIRKGTMPNANQGVLVVMDNVAEVFEMGPN